MVLVSIIVGLGLTHILSGLGAAIPRLLGHGPPIRIEVVYLSWVGVLFTWMASFWWFEYRWNLLAPELSWGLFFFIVTYAVLLFSLAMVLVPHRLEIVDDTWRYLLSVRKWFYGGLLLVNALDLIDTFLKGVDWGIRPIYIIMWSSVTVAALMGLFSKRRVIHAALGIGSFILQFASSFSDLWIRP
jgi:hypothetical protein